MREAPEKNKEKREKKSLIDHIPAKKKPNLISTSSS
jgi:hypothetical protein